MSEPVRWPGGGEAQSADEVRAAELLHRMGAPPTWNPAAKRQVLRHIRTELDRRPARARSPWVFVAAVTSVCALVLAIAFTHRHSVSAAVPAEVVASSGTDYAWAAEEGSSEVLGLVIRLGTVEVHPRNPARAIAVHSPGLEARVEAEMFRVQVAAEVTTLSIGEGQAWVGKTVHLRRHESIRSDDPRLQRRAAPSAPAPSGAPAIAAPATPPAAPCVPTGSPADRSACLAQLSQGKDLAAQNALFELGMLQVDELHAGQLGVESFRAYGARFPSGALASDAAFAALNELVAEHRTDDAVREAELFLRRFPQDARASEVRETQRSLTAPPP